MALTQLDAVQAPTGEFTMKLTTTIVALAIVALAASTASAQHFDRQRKEAATRQAAAQHHFGHQRAGGAHHGVSGHWGGPTTYNRFYHPTHGRGTHQNIQYYPVNPYGYGVPGYGYYGGFPCYGAPYGGTGVYIHREIHLGR